VIEENWNKGCLNDFSEAFCRTGHEMIDTINGWLQKPQQHESANKGAAGPSPTNTSTSSPLSAEGQKIKSSDFLDDFAQELSKKKQTKSVFSSCFSSKSNSESDKLKIELLRDLMKWKNMQAQNPNHSHLPENVLPSLSLFLDMQNGAILKTDAKNVFLVIDEILKTSEPLSQKNSSEALLGNRFKEKFYEKEFSRNKMDIFLDKTFSSYRQAGQSGSRGT
jgi:hypothetical protein